MRIRLSQRQEGAVNGDEKRRLDMPDHTNAQIAALVQAVIAVAVAFGVDITEQQSVALIALSGLIGTVLIGADAAIRRERARNADKLLPQASVTATQGEGGTEVKAEVVTPLGTDTGVSQVDMAEFLTLMKQFLRDSGLILQPGPGNGAERPEPAPPTPRRASTTRSRPRGQ
jgi:hypothetical protein